MAAPVPGDANKFIEQQLDERIGAIEALFEADGLSFSGPILFGVDDLLRISLERLKSASPKDRLVVVLTTTGGFIEVVQRIVDSIRHHYKTVLFVVPNYAYSAGTVLVMSGDKIYMDYYARLGPIDPQSEKQDGKMVPALGYLEQYARLIRKAQKGKITAAEVQVLLTGFDQAELYQYEQTRELSIALLKEWLVNYKFKDWKKTETRKKVVTKQMRTSRAGQIARSLNNTKKWHVHGHGISMAVLQRDLKVKIDDFGANKEFDSRIRGYYDLLNDYMLRRTHRGVVHTKGSYQPFM